MSYGSLKIEKNSLFLKITEGKPQTVRLLDASPTEQFNHKLGDNKLVTCTGDMCAHCNAGVSKSQRFVSNVYCHNDGKVYLWSFGAMIASAVKAIALSLEKDDEEITNHDLEVSVSGSGMQTKYTVQLRIKSQPVPEGLKLHEIKSKVSDLAF